MNLVTNLTPKQLRQAADIQERIQTLQAKLSELLGAQPAAASTGEAQAPKKRQMSAAGRAAIRAAQKARWAKIKAAQAEKGQGRR